MSCSMLLEEEVFEKSVYLALLEILVVTCLNL
jgi:hypothetical protein